jgi:phosphatidylethanolamine-binding protein (PEBP) family uncharacterized protein
MLEHAERRSRTSACCTLILAALLCGCGSSGSQSASNATATHATTTQPSKHKNSLETISLISRAVHKGGTISARYTCDGKDVSLPLSWRGVPAGTTELALFLARVVRTARGASVIGLEWGVAGLKPTLTGVAAGGLPPGAMVARNDAGKAGYSLCPTGGGEATYAVLLYALPRRVSPTHGITAAALRKQVEGITKIGGAMTFHYARPAPPEAELTSPVPLNPIATRYTCDGAGESPPLIWRHLPQGTPEVVVYMAVNQGPVHGRYRIVWAVAGLDPTLHGLSAGRLPAGAVVGRNSLGKNAYTVCPPKGTSQKYVLVLFALKHRLHLHAGFDAPGMLGRLLQNSEKLTTAHATYRRP